MRKGRQRPASDPLEQQYPPRQPRPAQVALAAQAAPGGSESADGVALGGAVTVEVSDVVAEADGAIVADGGRPAGAVGDVDGVLLPVSDPAADGDGDDEPVGDPAADTDGVLEGDAHTVSVVALQAAATPAGHTVQAWHADEPAACAYVPAAHAVHAVAAAAAL